MFSKLNIVYCKIAITIFHFAALYSNICNVSTWNQPTVDFKFVSKYRCVCVYAEYFCSCRSVFKVNGIWILLYLYTFSLFIKTVGISFGNLFCNEINKLDEWFRATRKYYHKNTFRQLYFCSITNWREKRVYSSYTSCNKLLRWDAFQEAVWSFTKGWFCI